MVGFVKPDAKPLLAAVSVDIFHVPVFDPRLQPAPVAGAETGRRASLRNSGPMRGSAQSQWRNSSGKTSPGETLYHGSRQLIFRVAGRRDIAESSPRSCSKSRRNRRNTTRPWRVTPKFLNSMSPGENIGGGELANRVPYSSMASRSAWPRTAPARCSAAPCGARCRDG